MRVIGYARYLLALAVAVPARLLLLLGLESLAEQVFILAVMIGPGSLEDD